MVQAAKQIVKASVFKNKIRWDGLKELLLVLIFRKNFFSLYLQNKGKYKIVLFCLILYDYYQMFMSYLV